jgi:hypothetical protein
MLWLHCLVRRPMGRPQNTILSAALVLVPALVLELPLELPLELSLVAGRRRASQ